MTAHRHRAITLSSRHRRKQIIRLGAVLILALTLLLGFYLGQRSARDAMELDPESYRSMQLALPAAQQELAALQGEMETQFTRHEVDRRALEMVRRDMADQKQRIADLEENLRFYKGLMAPEEVARGLSLRAIELVAQQEPRRYAYRIVVQQEARKHELLKGKLAVEVVGVLAGQEVNYPLVGLSDELTEELLVLSFRYFQAIQGYMTLPEGFVPTDVRVVASVSSPQKIEAREQYPWHLQESFTHVGK